MGAPGLLGEGRVPLRAHGDREPARVETRDPAARGDIDGAIEAYHAGVAALTTGWGSFACGWGDLSAGPPPPPDRPLTAAA